MNQDLNCFSLEAKTKYTTQFHPPKEKCFSTSYDMHNQYGHVWGQVVTHEELLPSPSDKGCFSVTEILLALKGSTVQIKCTYMANRDVGQRLLWIKGSIILSENIILGNTDVKDRLKVTGDHSIGEYHLNISDIKESDEENISVQFQELLN
ncbi:unnamed protein product [Mytilus edulis]|uniref:Uncharacterized protein n=1 Tax=Mytilus edulis TaxID=6550 RepID=A0A8S3PTE7_MYTED|nr:unnamed protein product [Mytilus edulis]